MILFNIPPSLKICGVLHHCKVSVVGHTREEAFSSFQEQLSALELDNLKMERVSNCAKGL